MAALGDFQFIRSRRAKRKSLKGRGGEGEKEERLPLGGGDKRALEINRSC